CDAEEKAFLKDIEKLIKKTVTPITDQPYHSTAVVNAQLMSKGKAKAAIEGKRGGGGGRGGNRRRGRGGPSKGSGPNRSHSSAR
ncbi:MAG TPA: hypothetical protein VM432_11620, partial [Bdellovibrionales bacterium]|nr:hypothetical protein [Bdellovibrionales bacterium]